MKSNDGARLEGCAPFQLTVTPWWVMSSVWLTVTDKFENSLSMNESDPVPAARSAFEFSWAPPSSVLLDPVIGWLLEFSRPLVQFTVMAEAVDPTPVIWL